MPDVNLDRPEWDFDVSEPPFRARAMRLGPRTGARELGATLYELDPGGAISPYHVHHGNEEMLLVLSGTPELRVPDGSRRLEAGAVGRLSSRPARRSQRHQPGPGHGPRADRLDDALP